MKTRFPFLTSAPSSRPRALAVRFALLAAISAWLALSAESADLKLGGLAGAAADDTVRAGARSDTSGSLKILGNGCPGFQVNSTADAPDANIGDFVCADVLERCTLRAAIQEANATFFSDGKPVDTICLPAGTYTLTIPDEEGDESSAETGDLDFEQGLTILGSGADSTIVDGGAGAETVVGAAGLVTRRVFDVQANVDDPGVTLMDLTVRGGLASGRGGGIRVRDNAHIHLQRVVVEGNAALSDGGGIAFEGSSTGNIEFSAISGNSTISGGGDGFFEKAAAAGTSQRGGGIFVGDFNADISLGESLVSGNDAPSANFGDGIYSFGVLALTNTTVSGNRLPGEGGTGLLAGSGTVTIDHATFADNASSIEGWEIDNSDANVTLHNTILGGLATRNCSNPVDSSGGNIDTGTTCKLDSAGDLSNTDPKLAPLADNGGPTATHGLLPGSPAVDAVTSGCPPPAIDQRNFMRPIGPACDIGAFEGELLSADLSLTKGDSPDPVAAGSSLTYTLTVSNAGPDPASSIVVTDTLPAGVGFVSASGSGWSCSQAGGTVTCTRSSLAAGAAPAITIQVTAPEVSGSITNNASVSSATPDPLAGNNSVSAMTTVTGVSPCNPPPAPIGLKITPVAARTGDAFLLRWSAAPGALQYEVVMSRDGATFSPLGYTPGTEFGGVVPGGITPGSFLLFKVRGDPLCFPPALGPFSEPVSLEVTTASCPTPDTPTVTLDKTSVPAGDSFTATWDATIPPNQTGHYLVRVSVGGGPPSVTQTSALSHTVTTTAADANKTIGVTVQAVTVCAEVGTSVPGAESAPAIVSVTQPCVPPSAPVNLRIENANDPALAISPVDAIRLSWQPGPGGGPVTSYLYRINGAVDTPSFDDPYAGSTTGTSVLVPPRGENTDPMQLFVTPVGCQPGTQAQSAVVIIADLPPVADFTISPSPRVGSPVTFTDTSQRAVTYFWITNEGQNASTQHFTVTFSTAGPKSVVLFATNGAGTDTEIKTLTVAPATASALSLATVRIGFDQTDPERRQARLRVKAAGSSWLRITSKEPEDLVIFLRFLGSDGRPARERRLVVAPGAEALFDLGALAPEGEWTVELVSRRLFDAEILQKGRPIPREVRR